MAEIVFYEKPGCINNTRQKKLLAQSGHEVVCKNLLLEPWTEERLLEFFKDSPIALWFNRSAPAVKSGEIVPERCDASTALYEMIKDPLLIRRPLMEYEGETMVGFDYMRVNDWIGLVAGPGNEELEQCVRQN